MTTGQRRTIIVSAIIIAVLLGVFAAWLLITVRPGPIINATPSVQPTRIAGRTPSPTSTPTTNPQRTATPVAVAPPSSVPSLKFTATPTATPIVTLSPPPTPLEVQTPTPSATASLAPIEASPVTPPVVWNETPTAVIASVDSVQGERLSPLSDTPPPNDPRALALRYGKVQPEWSMNGLSRMELGAQKSFWVRTTEEIAREVTAVLVYRSTHLDFWVEKGQAALNTEAQFAQIASQFEAEVYPVAARFFAPMILEPSVTVLHATGMGENIYAYYADIDELPQYLFPLSNEASMIYVNLDSVTLTSEYYMRLLAHEWQHVLQRRVDPNEELWLNEGMSELMATLATGPMNGLGQEYLRHADIPLLAWNPKDAPLSAYYGGAYLFLRYLLDRFGDDFLRTVIASPNNGIDGFRTSLAEMGLDFAGVYIDWVLSNGLHDKFVHSGLHTSFPIRVDEMIHPFGVDAIEIYGGGGKTFYFQGQPEAPLISDPIPSGEYIWWSNQVDGSDTILTRAFDLSSVSTAHLTYSLWYDIESKDCAYAAVSIDGGQSWQVLHGEWGRTDKVEQSINCNLGPRYVGRSGDERQSRWVRESIDLTHLAGQEVLLRFEYVTDQSGHGQGLALDDIAIPEIGYFDDAERIDGWQPHGFVHLRNSVPVRFFLAAIEFRSDGPVVSVLDVEPSGQATFLLPQQDNPSQRTIFLISAMAPYLEQPVSYTYGIR